MESVNKIGLALVAKDAEITSLRAEVARLRTALERCVQTLGTCDVNGEPHMTLDAAITGLAKVAGEGPVMRAVIYAWRRNLQEAGVCQSALQNYFTVGPTLYAVKNALAVGRSALGGARER
jgi:hypothetical protein